MPFRIVFFIALFLFPGCSGGDKHLPTSNPPEYDPKKIYTPPATPAGTLPTVTQPAKPTELELLRAKLDALEADQKAKGEGKKVPFDPKSLQLFQGVTSPCEALSKLAQGLGSQQLFEGNEGAALKKALGPDADEVARRMDEQLAEGLKHSLGPGAADCPISGRPQKKSGLSQPARVVLTHASSTQPFLLAQTTVPETSQEDYDVNDPPMRKEDAPPDWVGYKATDTMTRIGKVGRPTEGIYESYDMVIAPKAKRCPHLEGPDLEGVADGAFEWSFVMARTTPEQLPVLYRRHVVANLLKGKVDDDAKIQYVDYDVTVTLQHIGRELAPYSQSYGIRGHFMLDQRIDGVPQELRVITVSRFSEGEAQARDAQLLGTMMALMAYFSHEPYHRAQAYWNNPNTCVEIIFTPPTKTKKFVPNESTPVKTELRTKKGSNIVPAKLKEARERPREGNGRVSPREERSELNRPATFTYQAPATKVQHSGFRLMAVSRAGVAKEKEGEWELAPSAYILEFKSHIVQKPVDVLSSWGLTVSANGFDAQVEAMVPLQYTDDRGWVGEGEMRYVTRTTTNPTLCEIRIQGTGTTTFHVNGGSINLDPEPFTVKLIILPGQTEEMAEVHCEGTTARGSEKIRELLATQGVQGANAYSSTKSGGWRAAFNLSRFRSFIWTPGRQGYEIGGWTQVLNSDVVAKKTMRVDCGGSAVLGATLCQEETTLTLRLADESRTGASPRP